MPYASDIKPYIKDVALISLCSPLNPTGTVLTEENLREICDLILEENHIRISEGKKPVYLMFDQIYWVLTYGDIKHISPVSYWVLTYGDIKHISPVSIYPEMKNFTIFIDGMSKYFAATGVRLGWSLAPASITDRFKTMIAHMGAWAPKAEQIAASHYLKDTENVDKYLEHFKDELSYRLNKFYEGLTKLKDKGFGIEVIPPQAAIYLTIKAAIYLTIKVDLIGKKKPDGCVISSSQDTTRYLINEAKMGVVPFYAFGSPETSQWF